MEVDPLVCVGCGQVTVWTRATSKPIFLNGSSGLLRYCFISISQLFKDRSSVAAFYTLCFEIAVFDRFCSMKLHIDSWPEYIQVWYVFPPDMQTVFSHGVRFENNSKTYACKSYCKTLLLQGIFPRDSIWNISNANSPPNMPPENNGEMSLWIEINSYID